MAPRNRPAAGCRSSQRGPRNCGHPTRQDGPRTKAIHTRRTCRSQGQTVAFLSANSAETWCAGVAASGLGVVTTWLHPLGALGDHLEVIEDAEASVLIVDPRTHGQRGGELAAAAAARLEIVLTM